MKLLKNRPHSKNADRLKGDRLNPKFEEIIEEMINNCKEIRQILYEAEQAVSRDASTLFTGRTAIKEDT